jgi:hypothetical protein
MFEWIKVWFLEATRQTIDLPIHAAAPLMVLVGAIDSSLLSLPEVNDYITVSRSPLFSLIPRYWISTRQLPPLQDRTGR